MTITRPGLALALLWLFVQLMMLWLFGIGQGGDSQRYLRAGRTITQGEMPTGKATSYPTYNLTVAASLALGFDQAGLITFQLAMSAIAAYCLYRLASHQWNQAIGTTAAFLYIIFLKLHPWNVFILTESLFISFIIITSYLFLKAYTSKSPLLIISTIITAAYTTFLRPDGLAIPLAFSVLALVTIYQKRAWKTLGILVVLAALIAPTAWQFGGRLAEHEFLVRHYAEGAIIWHYEPYYLTMPGSLPPQVSENTNPIFNLIYFALDKPFYILKLAGLKILLFLIHIRPYHSFLHNLLIVIWLAVLYPAAYFTLKKNPGRYPTLTIFLVSLFIFKALIAGATFADWSGRFFLHVAPILLLFASPTLQKKLAEILPRAKTVQILLPYVKKYSGS